MAVVTGAIKSKAREPFLPSFRDAEPVSLPTGGGRAGRFGPDAAQFLTNWFLTCEASGVLGISQKALS